MANMIRAFSAWISVTMGFIHGIKLLCVYVFYVVKKNALRSLILYCLKNSFTLILFSVVKKPHSCIFICGYAMRSLIFPISPNTIKISYNPIQ
jgi:hypothetical protein